MTLRGLPRSPLGLLAIALFVLAGCGYIGPTKPPTLDIPARITDFRAAEYGPNIVVEFTLPAVTTEGLPLSRVDAVTVWVGASPTPFSERQWQASAKREEVPPAAPGAFNYMLPAQDWIGKEIVLGVRATGPKGKASDWSNLVSLTIGQPLATPTMLKAENAPQGVRLTWQGSGPRYRIFRVVGSMPPDRLADSEQPDYLDSTASYGQKYSYMVQALAGELRQSEVSPRVEITPEDTFPPAVPRGLSAVPGSGTIELAWERNTEDDFQSYTLYRSVDGGPLEALAPMLQTPAYSDRQVDPGKRYRYTVSATDNRGNESAQSMPVEAVAQ